MARPIPKGEPLLGDEDLSAGDEELERFSHHLDFSGKMEEARMISETKARARE